MEKYGSSANLGTAIRDNEQQERKTITYVYNLSDSRTSFIVGQLFRAGEAPRRLVCNKSSLTSRI